MSKKATPNVQEARLKMPYSKSFIPFEDTKISFLNKFEWKLQNTIDLINFEVINRSASIKYKIDNVVYCREGDYVVILLLEHADASTIEKHTSKCCQGIIFPSQLKFYFVVNSKSINERELCDAATIKPKTRDGYIIFSV